jgi:transcriptional regulator with XRE-family HTH domain
MSPVKNNPLPEVIGSSLKAARENRKLERLELANLCCLSAKMILELEEGGMSSFYSFPLKVNAAKRVGNFLNLVETDYLLFPRPVAIAVESPEGGSPEIKAAESAEEATSQPELLGAVADVAPVEPSSPTTKDEVRAGSLDPAITERLEWQELLTEKVGGDVSGPDAGRRFHLPIKPVLFLSLGLAVAGLLFGLNTKYDLVYQVASLMESKPITPAAPLEDAPKDGVEEVKVEVQAEPAPSQESKPAEVKVAADQCPYKPNAQILSFQSPNPSKAGDVVNLKTLVKQTICFVDSAGKQLVMAMEANTALAFKGVAPFTVLAQDLDDVEMYFQGWRVRLPAAGTKQVKLLEVNQ